MLLLDLLLTGTEGEFAGVVTELKTMPQILSTHVDGVPNCGVTGDPFFAQFQSVLSFSGRKTGYLRRGVVGVGGAGDGDPVRLAVGPHDRAHRGVAAGD